MEHSREDIESMDDLVHQAERLTAEIASDSTFPRVERNLKQLAEAGQQLWSRTTQSHIGLQNDDVKASVLLGSKGFDLQRVTQRLDSLQSKKGIVCEAVAVPDVSLDIQAFLKKERETAIMSVIEEVKKSTIERIDQLFFENMQKDWEKNKLAMMTELTARDASTTGTSFAGDFSVQSQQTFTSPSEPITKKLLVDNILRMITKGENYESVVGSVSSDGCRIQGTLAKMLEEQQLPLSWKEIVTDLAQECHKQAFLEEAVKLYDLLGEETTGLEILNQILAPIVSQKSTPEDTSRERLEDLALKLASRYARNGSSANKTVLSTFHLLLDLMTFFSYYHKQTFYDALDTIQKLNLIPLDVTTIDAKVNDFKHLSIEIQRTIPDILLACMNILYAQYRENKSASTPSVAKFGMSPDHSREARLTDIRSKAKALITYAGMIPYRMPRETNAKLVHLEVIMN